MQSRSFDRPPKGIRVLWSHLLILLENCQHVILILTPLPFSFPTYPSLFPPPTYHTPLLFPHHTPQGEQYHVWDVSQWRGIGGDHHHCQCGQLDGGYCWVCLRHWPYLWEHLTKHLLCQVSYTTAYITEHYTHDRTIWWLDHVMIGSCDN